MTIMLTQLADVLRAAGLTVVEVPGWKTRGKPWASNPDGFMAHHTGGGDNVPGAVAFVRDGDPQRRPPLPGPLSQFVLAPDGAWHVIAAGRSNHAGAGRWHGITAGNAEFLGCEAMNRGDGKDPWEQAQVQSYARGAAALAEHFGFPALMVIGHKEWAPGRKIDPTFDMRQFRALVADIMDDSDTPAGHLPTSPPAIVNTDPSRDMLQRGDEGPEVLELQKKLRSLGFACPANGIFSWMTDTALRNYQRSRGLKDDGKAGPKTWAKLDGEKA